MDQKKSIFHFGILGMKWGRRKASGPSSEDRKVLTEVKGKQVHELSNLQIRKAAERIQLERQYKDLTVKPSHPAVKAVNDILASQGKMMVSTFVASASALAIKYMIENKSTILDQAANLIKLVPKGG
jgi:hypothetical protein